MEDIEREVLKGLIQDRIAENLQDFHLKVYGILKEREVPREEAKQFYNALLCEVFTKIANDFKDGNE